ncbi:MAG: endonuclease III domain-containing protein [Candidatus Thorarchaeota archaeon]
MADEHSPLRKKVSRICKLLMKQYGNTIVDRKLPPIDELVLTILSQNTNDVNMYRAFDSLKETYSTWEQVMNAPSAELGVVIKSSGFFRVKAKRIKATLLEIQHRVGKLELDHLEKMSLEDATNWLTSLHGVGPKTAAIVLLFCFGKATLPVDTHVWRVTKRLGLIPENTSRENAQVLLESIIPTSCIYSLNHNLIRLGREICRARKPTCTICFLSSSCEFVSRTG